MVSPWMDNGNLTVFLEKMTALSDTDRFELVSTPREIYGVL
jgi:hypothetical protein